MVKKGRHSSQERLESFNRIWDSLKEIDAPVIVEGKRDTVALRKLGYSGNLIELNDGKSVHSTVEKLVRESSPPPVISLKDVLKLSPILL